MDVEPDNRARVKSAELLSAAGALALGVGLGAMLSSSIGRAAIPILVVGIASHSWGMLQKHRLEQRQGEAGNLWWEAALYWVCWIMLAGLLVLVSIKALAG